MHRCNFAMTVLAAACWFCGSAWAAPVQPATANPETSAHPKHTSSVRHRHGRRHHAARPVSPPKSDARPGGTDALQPAPVPNEDARPPETDTAATPEPSLHPGQLQMHFPPSGEGYLPGSSHTEMDNLNTPKVPGVTIKLPVGDPTAPP